MCVRGNVVLMLPNRTPKPLAGRRGVFSEPVPPSVEGSETRCKVADVFFYRSNLKELAGPLTATGGGASVSPASTSRRTPPPPPRLLSSLTLPSAARSGSPAGGLRHARPPLAAAHFAGLNDLLSSGAGGIEFNGSFKKRTIERIKSFHLGLCVTSVWGCSLSEFDVGR